MHDPVLQLDQFALQTDQLAEVEPAIHIPLGGIRPNRIPVEQGLHAVVVEFHLQLFVKAVEQLVMQMGSRPTSRTKLSELILRLSGHSTIAMIYATRAAQCDTDMMPRRRSAPAFNGPPDQPMTDYRAGCFQREIRQRFPRTRGD